MKYFFSVCAVVLFLGCSSKYEFANNDSSAKQALVHTKKFEFTQNDIRYLLIVTYLSPINSFKDNSKELFLVNVYTNKQNKNDIHLEAISVNDKTQDLHVKKIEQNDKILNNLAFKNKWSKYFLVSSPAFNSSKIKLFMEIDKIKKVLVNFPKDILN